jgi:hypothetical protein
VVATCVAVRFLCPIAWMEAWGDGVWAAFRRYFVIAGYQLSWAGQSTIRSGTLKTEGKNHLSELLLSLDVS